MSITMGEVLAKEVYFDGDMLCAVLTDNRVIKVPLTLFPRLAAATETQRNNFEFFSPDVGIHWPDIDEDISIASLLAPQINVAPGSQKLKPYALEKISKKNKKSTKRAVIDK